MSTDRQPSDRHRHADLPVYAKIWATLQHFPPGLAKGARQPPATSGAAAAALISAGVGCFLLMVAHHLAEISMSWNLTILNLGNLIPGSIARDRELANIGIYVGKEIVLILSWCASWIFLHYLLKERSIGNSTIFMWTLGLFVAATVMSWQPLFPYLPIL